MNDMIDEEKIIIKPIKNKNTFKSQKPDTTKADRRLKQRYRL